MSRRHFGPDSKNFNHELANYVHCVLLDNTDQNIQLIINKIRIVKSAYHAKYFCDAHAKQNK